MSLYCINPRNQTQSNYQHQYPQKDQIHSRSHSQYWRGKNELDYPRGTIAQNQENKMNVPRYQHGVQEKFNQRSQEECNRTTQYFEQMPNKSKYNDFSFEERSQKIKTQASNNDICVRQNARKKGTEMKINNIDQLNDKIYSLLSLIKKQIHKSNSRHKQKNEVSLSPSKNNQSQYQQSFDYSNRSKDIQSNYQANFNRYNVQPTNQLTPLSSIENQRYTNRSISAKKTKVEYSNNLPLNPQPTVLRQNSQNNIDRRDNASLNKFIKQSQRVYENNTGKQFVKKRQETLVMKSIDELLNQRRKMLNIKREEQPVYSYGKSIETEAKNQEGSPINQFKNQQKGLYTIQQNETESLATPSEGNKQKKYQYFVQKSPQNEDEGEIHNQKHFNFTGKIYKKSQQLTPKQSKPRLEIDLS